MKAVDVNGNLYASDGWGNAVRMLRPVSQPVVISSVLDGARASVGPVSPGKIVVIYGGGLGPSQLVRASPANDVIGSKLSGTTVSFNGIDAPILYVSATQIGAIVPYGVSGDTAEVVVTAQGQISTAFKVTIAASGPSIFSLNQTGAGQAAAVNGDGSLNDAVHPVKTGGYISLYATGEGQTSPPGVDGKLLLAQPYPKPILPVKVTVGGLPASFTYAGAAPTAVAGLMQIVVQIPAGVEPGGYVPVVLQVGNAASSSAIWIAVAAN